MRRYILALIFAIAVVGLYRFVNIRLFSLDLTKQVKDALFFVRVEPDKDRSLVLLNIPEII